MSRPADWIGAHKMTDRLDELIEVRSERVEYRTADVVRLEQELDEARRSLTEAVTLLREATQEQKRRQA